MRRRKHDDATVVAENEVALFPFGLVDNNRRSVRRLSHLGLGRASAKRRSTGRSNQQHEKVGHGFELEKG